MELWCNAFIFVHTLGFDIGPLVLPSRAPKSRVAQFFLRKRGGAMLGAIEKHKLFWTSDLPLQRKL